MCRSIKTLRRPGEAATTGELEAAARQYVRKLSGYREPSAKNREAFEAAIAEIAHASQHLVEALGVDVEDGPDSWVGRDGVIHIAGDDRGRRALVGPAGSRRRRPTAACASPAGTPRRSPASTARRSRLRPRALRRDRPRVPGGPGHDRAAVSGCASRIKANPRPEILAVFRALGAPGTPESVGIDACSPGEVLRALECGWRPDEISYTGTNVSERDLDVLLAHGIHLNLDALSQIERYGRRAPGTRIGLRIDPAAGAGYTDTSSTAGRARRSSGSGSSASTRRSPWSARHGLDRRHHPLPRRVGLAGATAWPAFERALPAAVEAVERARAAGHPVERGQRRRRAGPAGAGRRAGRRPRRLRRRPGPPSRAARRDHRLRAGRPPVEGRGDPARRGRDDRGRGAGVTFVGPGPRLERQLRVLHLQVRPGARPVPRGRGAARPRRDRGRPHQRGQRRVRRGLPDAGGRGGRHRGAAQRRRLSRRR